jgi:hypothetical protein
MRRLFLILSLLFLTACGRDESWRQKLTLVVETPAGLVTGSAVTEITKKDDRYWWAPPEARGVHSYVRGEAVAVEVLPGRWLFALLDGRQDGKGDAGHLVYPAFALDQAREASGRRSYEAAMRKLRDQPLDTPVEIPPSDYPMLVTFEDIADPSSVRRVDPADLSASFGPGVRLKAVTLEITAAEVTEGRLEGVLTSWIEMRSERNNAIESLKLPDNSPRGWNHLDPLEFWSLDKVLELNRRTK